MLFRRYPRERSTLAPPATSYGGLMRLKGFAVVIALAIAAQSCAPAASTGPIQTVQPTAVATAAATFTVPATFAAVCGTASDRVPRTASTNATFVLNSPGRPPLKLTSTGDAPIDVVIPGGYVCLLLEAGVPFPIFGGLTGPYLDGFVLEGTLPATSAKPAPTGFVLPQACAFVAPPVVGTDLTAWAVDCGAQANRDARGTLAPALIQQGWTSCGAVTATATWAKGTTRLLIAESSLSPGDYPKLTQPVRPAASTSCP